MIYLRIGITEAGKNIPVVDNITAMYPAAYVLSRAKQYVASTESFVGKSSIEWKRPTVRPVNCWPPESIAGEAANISGSHFIGGVMSKRLIPIGLRSMPGGLA